VKGKTCLITGASAGIGLTTALGLAKLGATIIIASRDHQRGLKAREFIKEQTNNVKVEYLPVDLASFSSIHQMAENINSRYGKLDVLINNAGIFTSEKRLSEDGYELTFAVNHLAPFLLTNLLLESLFNARTARIINLVSCFHFLARIDINDLNFQRRNYNGLNAYNCSKLANVLFTYYLAGMLSKTSVTVNCSDPWGTNTGIVDRANFICRLLWNVQKPFLLTATKGARTSIYLATSDIVSGINGNYFRHCRQYNSSKASYDNEISLILWKECEKMTNISYNKTITSSQKLKDLAILNDIL
jgi:NAD(P)-dependent dehydrogenase (short-subunit alcohol dehydrogenase family)